MKHKVCIDHESALLPDEGWLGTVEIEWLLTVDMDVGDFRDSVTVWKPCTVNLLVLCVGLWEERTSEGAFRTDVATIGSVELSVGDAIRKDELERSRDNEEFEGVILEEIDTTKSKLFN